MLFGIARKGIEVATTKFWDILAFVANTVAFLFIGFSTNILSLGGSATAILVAYGVVVASRFLSVDPILGFPGIAPTPVPWSWRNVAVM